MSGLKGVLEIVRTIDRIGRIIAPINKKMNSDPDSHPRICQNISARLIERVILPSISSLPTHENVPTSGAKSQDEFLDWAEKHFDNASAADARAAFSLVLAATFERHLRRWLICKNIPDARKMPFENLLDAGLSTLPDQSRSSDLRVQLLELVLVGNVVRHGNGRSVNELLQKAPDLWHDQTPDTHEWLEGYSLHAEQMRIGEGRIRTYANAIILFWGLADLLPGSVLERGY